MWGLGNPGRVVGLARLGQALKHKEGEMKLFLKEFLRDEQGQDLIEYTLLMAFVALASAAIFTGAGSSISGIWGKGSTSLANADALAS
jgi:Flp pilus assembly pilin Flp